MTRNYDVFIVPHRCVFIQTQLVDASIVGSRAKLIVERLVPCRHTDDVTLVMHFSTRRSQRSRFTLCLRDGIPSFPLQKLRTRKASLVKKKKKYREIFSRRTKVEMEIREEFIFYDEIDENYFPRVAI